jgi:hypothetical protein
MTAPGDAEEAIHQKMWCCRRLVHYGALVRVLWRSVRARMFAVSALGVFPMQSGVLGRYVQFGWVLDYYIKINRMESNGSYECF